MDFGATGGQQSESKSQHMRGRLRVTILLSFLIAAALLNLAIGYALGWFRVIELLPAWAPLRPQTQVVQADTARDDETIRSTEFLSRLRELASNVQELTGQHSSRLGEITQALDAEVAAGNDPVNVLAAATTIIKANRQLEEELAQTKLEIEEQQRQLESTAAAARTDALTGILNRRAYDEELQKRFALFQRSGTPLCLLLLDVDHFKQFNDAHGHPAGDAVLRGVACVLSRTLRESDIFARYGGEEFCALLPATSLDEAKTAAERLRQAIAESHFEFEGTPLQVTVSIGLASALETDNDQLLLKRTDTALYEAKRNGRNCSYYHNGDTALPIALSEPGPGQPFSSVQRVAPYTQGRLPNLSKFREVHCDNLAASGFSFLTPYKPNYEQLAVAFGTPTDPFYRLAVVNHCEEVGTADKPMFRVACTFSDQPTDDEPAVSEPQELSALAPAELPTAEENNLATAQAAG